MRRNPPLFRAWICDLARPTVVAFAGLLVVGVMALLAQALARVPLFPGVSGLAAVALGFIPEMGAIALPIALFLGSASVGRRWQEGGELVGLMAGGGGGRTLVWPLLLTGLGGGLAVAALTHGPGPWGRAAVRDTLIRAASELRLEAGRSLQVGDVFIRVGGVDSSGWSDVFVAHGSVVASAPAGGMEPDGVLRLDGGTAKGLAVDGRRGWSLSFDTARMPLVPPPARIHAFEMSDHRLADLVARMEARGRSAHSERLVLYKRTTLALGVPLLVLLGLPLGMRLTRPGVGVVGTVLALWVVQRVGDHTAVHLGAPLAAAMPLLFLCLLTGACWWTWRDR